jgi:D-alanyl-D-alanine carboxypeptidase
MNLRFFPRQAIKIFFFIIALIAILAPSHAHALTRHHHTHHFAGVARTATYADIVIDAESGHILHASDPDGLRHPASLTKMMTLYLTFQALEAGRISLHDQLPVSAHAAEQSPSKLGLRRGQHIEVEDAILGVVTESANDAAVVLAEALGGDENHFAQMMTEEAEALGMNHTSYRNASGLPNPAQVTTARDMAVLGHALIYHFVQFYPYFSHEAFTYEGITHENHNHLMSRYDGMDGIKTGYIRASGFNLVASAMRGDTRLIGVVFGGPSTTARDNQMALLLDNGFAMIENGASTTHMAANSVNFAEGDSAGTDEDNTYVSLPAKTAMMNPSTASPQSGTWGVQIGAYDNPDLGHEALTGLIHMMPQLLTGTNQIVEKVSIGGIFMYRARLVGMNEKTARAVCAYMVKHGRSCLTVGSGPT